MSGDRIVTGFKCDKCGGTIIELPDGYTDDSIAKCKSCGQEIGTWGQFKDASRKVAADRARDIRKGIKRK